MDDGRGKQGGNIPKPRRERIVVFAPHPDDETLACGGTIANSIRQGKDVYIIVMTDGRNSHRILLSIDRNPNPRELIPIRKFESQRATGVLGVRSNHLFFLGFEDGTLAFHRKQAGKAVLEHLVKLKPDTIFMPDKSDAHPDHSTTGGLVLDAVRESGIDPTVYSYTVWTNDVIKKPKSANEVELDISRSLAVKCAAIKEYKSQVTKLFQSQNRPVLDESMMSQFRLPTEQFMFVLGRRRSR
jgi:LmbE family N-acetylglucosaminyl deacetylase